MSNRTYSRNAFESQLNGGITSGATTITLDSTTGLTQPVYLVISPDDPALREYIRADGISGSQLTSVSRGLDGSAAGAQAHNSGEVVRAVMVHQIVDDTFDDIEALEAADTAHFGGTDTADHPEATTSVRGFMSAGDKTKLDGIDAGAQADHAGLSGITTDDHHARDHAATHAAAGADPVAHDGLTGVGTDNHHARDHASTHLPAGADPLPADVIGTSQIIDESVTAAKLADTVMANLFQSNHNTETNPGSLTTSYAAVTSASFTLPAGWTSAFVMAWGWIETVGTVDSRIIIGTNGGLPVSGNHPMLVHAATVTANATVALQAKRTGSGSFNAATIFMVAFRIS